MDSAQPPTDAVPAAPSNGDVAATYCATLVDEWVRLGLTDAVVAPGSRSTPMALALVQHEGVRVHVHIDERSASFMALGIAKRSRRPVAVLCTSGTAAVEFHAAVVEAHQAFVPLLVLTADRPAELHNVGAPQTIDQRDLYGTSVRWYCEPGVPNAGGATWWRDMATDAWVRTGGEHPGPVHLNLAFAEPLLGSAGELPPAPTGAPRSVPDGAQWGFAEERVADLVASYSGRRGVIVAGERAVREPADLDAVQALADHLRWPILADAQSGCRAERDGCVTTYDPLLRVEEFASEHRPEFVLRIGGLSSSKVLGAWLSSSGAVQVGIDRYGAVPDPDRVVGITGPADVATVCDQLRRTSAEPAPAEWLDSWVAADAVARHAIGRVIQRRLDVTEPGVAIDLASLLGDGGVLATSSSMPVRDLEWFAPARDGLEMIANRGANGIDGVISTAVGAALADGAPTALFIGDVAFCHDASALTGLARRKVNLVIVVVDNGGGGIFSFLPQHHALDSDVFEALFGTPPGVDLVALAGAHGLPAERVSTRAGTQAAIAGALTRGGVRVVVVDSDRDANVEVHQQLNSAVATAWATRVGSK